MGLPSAANKTIHKEMRCAIRSCNPWLNARLNVVIVRISTSLSKNFISKLSENQLMDKLNVAEELYKKWENSYRLKEVWDLKAELLDKSEEPHRNGNAYRRLEENTESYLMWSPSTCLM